MQVEFERIAGYEVSVEDYNNIIEPMYMATDLDKYEFVKVIDRKRFEVKHEKSPEQIQLEDKLKEELETINSDIKYYKDIIETLNEEYAKGWKTDIKIYKGRIKEFKNRKYEIEFILA